MTKEQILETLMAASRQIGRLTAELEHYHGVEVDCRKKLMELQAPMVMRMTKTKKVLAAAKKIPKASKKMTANNGSCDLLMDVLIKNPSKHVYIPEWAKLAGVSESNTYAMARRLLEQGKIRDVTPTNGRMRVTLSPQSKRALTNGAAQVAQA
jgi:hypothetical protein